MWDLFQQEGYDLLILVRLCLVNKTLNHTCKNLIDRVKNNYVLSIDVGTRNACICLLYSHNKVPVPAVWEILDFKEISGYVKHTDLCSNMVRTLSENAQLHNPFCPVVIEQQPSSNIVMKMISMCLFTYFKTKNFKRKVFFTSAKNKYKADGELDSRQRQLITKNYYQRKKFGKNLAVKILKRHGLKQHAEFLVNQKKGDDLADAFLQAVFVTNVQIQIKKKTHHPSTTPDIRHFLDAEKFEMEDAFDQKQTTQELNMCVEEIEEDILI